MWRHLFQIADQAELASAREWCRLALRELLGRSDTQQRVAKWIMDHQIQTIVLEQPTRSLRNSRKHIVDIQRI